MATCNTAVLFEFSDITMKVGESVNLSNHISDLTGCKVTNYEMSPLPAGAVLDAGTGSFSWSPPAGTTPSPMMALIEEDSTFAASSYDYINFFNDPKLTSSSGFHSDNSGDLYWNIVTFPKDFKVHKFTLMKRGDNKWLDKIIN